MPLTNEQLHEIRQIIRDRHLAFIINAIGPDAVSAEILEALKAKGMVDVGVASIEDAYLFGQVLAATNDPKLAKMSYPEFKAHLQKNPVPLSPIERRAIQMAQQNAAQWVVGLGNRVDQQTGQLLIEADAELRAKTREIITDATKLNIAKRESVKKLKSDLGWAQKDWARDWDRIANTEKQTAMQQGVADNIAKTYGAGERVAKIPAPDACPDCKRLHLGPDGQPRIFKLADLQANGINNVGRKRADWLPVVGAVHPHCFAAGTKILTAKGEVPIENVLPGDFVLGRDGWRPVTHTWVTAYAGPMYQIDTGQKQLLVTPEHPFLVDAGNGPEWRLASALQKGNQLFETLIGDFVFDDAPTHDVPTTGLENGRFAAVLFGFAAGRVPITAVYFQGHLFVRESEIDQEAGDLETGVGFQAGVDEQPKDLPFVGRFELAGLASDGEADETLGLWFSPDRGMEGLQHFSALRFRHFAHAHALSFRSIARGLPLIFDALDYGATGNAEPFRYVFDRVQFVKMKSDDFGAIQVDPVLRPRHQRVLWLNVPIVNVSEVHNGLAPVYNLTVAVAHEYVANGILSHNCQCQLVRVPAGWGFDEDGDLVPGGVFGKSYESMEQFALAYEAEQRLQKAYALQGHVNFQGLDIAIENKAGTTRHWRDSDGNTGETHMLNAYGYIQGTEGADGDELDVFLGPDPTATMAYVIHQQQPGTGTYDEDKVMLGFASQAEAEAAYRRHYDRPDFYVATSPMPIDQLKRWAGVVGEDRPFRVGTPTETFVILEKARPHKYQSRKWVRGRWEYEYAEAEKNRTGLIPVSDAQVREVADQITAKIKANQHGVIAQILPGYAQTQLTMPTGEKLDVTVHLLPDAGVQDPRGIKGSAQTRVLPGVSGEKPEIESTAIQIRVRPGAAGGDLGELQKLVRSVLSHEMTHAVDPTIVQSMVRRAEKAKAFEHNANEGRTHADYLNEPAEVTARMQQIARDILDKQAAAEIKSSWDDYREFPEDMPPPYGPQDAVEWSPTWERVEAQLTPENRKRILRMAARLVEAIREGRASTIEKSLRSEGKIPAFVAAANSPAGDRAVSQGTVINQLVGARRTLPANQADMKPNMREHVEAARATRDIASQKKNREELQFEAPLEKPVERFMLPDREPYAVELDHQQIAANRKVVDDEAEAKAKSPKNRVLEKSWSVEMQDLTKAQQKRIARRVHEALVASAPEGHVVTCDLQKSGNARAALLFAVVLDADLAKAGGPFIGPKGGKWADPKHTIPWQPAKHSGASQPAKKTKGPLSHITHGDFPRQGNLKVAHPDELTKPAVHANYAHAGHDVIVAKPGKDPVPGRMVGVNAEGRPVVQYKGKQRTLHWNAVKLVEGQDKVAVFERLSNPEAIVYANAQHKELVKEVLQLEVSPGKSAREHLDWLIDRGQEVYLVGGIVRDMLAGVTHDVPKDKILEAMKDVDISTTANPQMGTRMAQMFGANQVRDCSPWGTVIIEDGVGIDYNSIVSPSKGELNSNTPRGVFDHDLEDDCTRRDFTANSLFYDVVNDTILDPTGKGIADAQARVLRIAPTPEEAKKNPAMPMRFWKFRARGWRADSDTLALMKEMMATAPPKVVRKILKASLKKGKTPAARKKIWNNFRTAMEADGAGDLWKKHIAPHKELV